MDTKARAKELLTLMAKNMPSHVKPTGLSVYQPQPSDIIIATFPKAGTTLLQNMVYQVAVASGSGPPFDPDGTNFSDICAVVPWVDYGPQFGVLECATSPRMFKTHAVCTEFDLDKSKFIYCVRNPLKYPGSMLDFLFEATTGVSISDLELRREIFNEYVRRALLAFPPSDTSQPTSIPNAASRYGTWFTHVQGWTETPRENILILFYEDVTTDLGRAARAIARFMGRSLSESAINTVVQRCDRKVMASDSKFVSMITARGLGLGDRQLKYILPEDRNGYNIFSLEESSMNAYQKMMLKYFGVDTYDAFCDLIRERQREWLLDHETTE